MLIREMNKYGIFQGDIDILECDNWGVGQGSGSPKDESASDGAFGYGYGFGYGTAKQLNSHYFCCTCDEWHHLELKYKDS